MQTTSNNLLNTLTDLALNKIYYKFKIVDTINLLLTIYLDLSKKVFSKLRLTKRKEINNIITFTSIFIKTKYDLRYLLFNLKKKNEVFLKLYYKYLIFSLNNRKLA